jgi:exosome complex component RRP4
MIKQEENNIESERKIVVPGEIIISGNDFLPGEGTRREGRDIVASRYGLAEISGRLVKIIALSGIYMPRRGNVIIGKVNDITFNGWVMDINAPYLAFLPAAECPRFISKDDIASCYSIGDMLVAKVDNVKSKGVDLTIKPKGLGKLDDGLVIQVNSNKVPRVIGREGSMVNLIKQETNCDIVVGQNGIIWIKGNKIEDELFAKEVIMFVTEKSHLNGLTERVEEYIRKRK